MFVNIAYLTITVAKVCIYNSYIKIRIFQAQLK
jgi:hypothetical protein